MKPKRLLFLSSVLGSCTLGLLYVGFATAPGKASAESPLELRCAIIGGMTDTGFWPGLMEQFKASTGLNTKVVATGPKQGIAEAFKEDGIDVVVMHSSDTIINLVADGYGENPQPWARNDLVIVGPKEDPAGIRGMKDAVEALKKIVESKNRIIMHSSLGANEVLRDLLSRGEIVLLPENTVNFLSERHREMLAYASEEGTYALVGRIPFRNGKIPSGNLELMVEGDIRMRRPYLVVIATEKRIGKERHEAAVKLAEFLRKPETQAWIQDFGVGVYDERPLFFPVVVHGEK